MTLTTLTTEQRAGMAAHVQRWIEVGLSTAPMDRVRAAQAVLKCYELEGLPMPRIEFVQSFEMAPPITRVAIRSTVLTAVGEAVGDAVAGEVWGLVLDAVWDTVRAAVGDAVGDAVEDAVWCVVWDAVCSGQYDAHTCAFLRFCVDALGVQLPADTCARLDAWCAIVESCGGVYWGRDVATIVDRPQEFERDSDGRITAVVYRDGARYDI